MAALAFGVFSTWYGFARWAPAQVAAALFLASAGVFLYFAFRPPVEICETHLAIGRRHIPWVEIRRLDRTGWLSPLVVHVTLHDSRRIRLVYPGDIDSANSLLRHLRRHAREALIDGIPYRQFWGEPSPSSSGAKPLPSPQYRLLRPEDEAEVERLYQRLKTVRHLDADNSTDEQ